MPTTTDGIRYPAGGDAPDVPLFLSQLAADISLRLPRIGCAIPYLGSGDPPGGTWLLADGRLIDKGAGQPGEKFFATVGHACNAGVDPGGGKVRISDLRGAAPIGADHMLGARTVGADTGIAARLTSGNLVGQRGGVESHTLNHNELPFGNLLEGGLSAGVHWAFATSTAGADIYTNHAGGAFGILGPYEVHNWIVRIL